MTPSRETLQGVAGALQGRTLATWCSQPMHKRRIRVSGEWREIQSEWWDALVGPKPPHGFENDGCSFVVDEIRGYALWPACVIHDYHFSTLVEDLEPDPPGFKHSNWIFWRNTYKILRLQGMNRFSAVFYATVRATAVTKLGRPFFRRR